MNVAGRGFESLLEDCGRRVTVARSKRRGEAGGRAAGGAAGPQVQPPNPGTPAQGLGPRQQGFQASWWDTLEGSPGHDQFLEDVIVIQGSVRMHLGPRLWFAARMPSSALGDVTSGIRKGQCAGLEVGPEKKQVRAKAAIATWKHPGVIPGDDAVISG